MKILNTMLGRQAIAAALVLSLAIPMSVAHLPKSLPLRLPPMTPLLQATCPRRMKV